MVLNSKLWQIHLLHQRFWSVRHPCQSGHYSFFCQLTPTFFLTIGTFWGCISFFSQLKQSRQWWASSSLIIKLLPALVHFIRHKILITVVILYTLWTGPRPGQRSQTQWEHNLQISENCAQQQFADCRYRTICEFCSAARPTNNLTAGRNGDWSVQTRQR